MDEPKPVSLLHSTRIAWREPLLLVVIVAAIYGARLTTLPVRGEESRWARVAVQMIEFGDWVIPRQQGLPYVDRPPLAQWAIAGMGLLAGEVDLLAIRLPSVLAVIAISLLIYVYARTFLSPLGAFCAGLIFATFGQVLQIGRLGENEALYCLFAGGAFLVWHWGYLRFRCSEGDVSVRRRSLVWSAGYAMAAGGALIKGPQAPAYFVVATGAYLLLRRDWRWLIGWHQLAGVTSFAVVFAIWQLPFFLSTDWETTIGMWTRTSAYRYSSHGLWEHIATYPFETLGCLLPWSPFLLGYLRPSVRRHLGGWSEPIVFFLIAIAVTYPTVWFAAGARGRYFMPLYPGFAVLIAFVVERSAIAARSTAARKGWDFYLGVLGVLALCGAVAITLASAGNRLVPSELAQPTLLVALFWAAASLFCVGWFWSRRYETPIAARYVLVGLSLLLGLSYTGLVITARAARSNDMTDVVSRLKQAIPDEERLVSFGAIDHRFAFYYRDFIPEIDWPVSDNDVPGGIRYFCFTHRRGDTPEIRRNGRGMYWETTSGTLPFGWEEIARIPCDRNVEVDPEVSVVIGRRTATSHLSSAASPLQTQK